MHLSSWIAKTFGVLALLALLQAKPAIAQKLSDLELERMLRQAFRAEKLEEIQLNILNPHFRPSVIPDIPGEGACFPAFVSKLTGQSYTGAYYDVLDQGILHFNPLERGAGGVVTADIRTYLMGRGVQMSPEPEWMFHTSSGLSKAVIASDTYHKTQVVILSIADREGFTEGHIVLLRNGVLEEKLRPYTLASEYWYDHWRNYEIKVGGVYNLRPYTLQAGDWVPASSEEGLLEGLSISRSRPTLKLSVPEVPLPGRLPVPGGWSASLWKNIGRRAVTGGKGLGAGLLAGVPADLLARWGARKCGAGEEGQHWAGSVSGYVAGGAAAGWITGAGVCATVFNPIALLFAGTIAINTSPYGERINRQVLEVRGRQWDRCYNTLVDPNSSSWERMKASCAVVADFCPN